MSASSLIDASGRFGDNNRLNSYTLPNRTLALVLAGGRGSRLEGLTDWRAKPAVPFGGKYRLIDFALSNCLNSGIGRVGILTQYMSHSLNQHVQQGWGMTSADGAPLMQLLPAQQRTKEHNWYSGTADAIYQNLDIIRGYGAEYVLVMAGDHIYKMDYRPLLEAHIQSSADMTICAIETGVDDAKQFGVLGVDDDGSVLRFTEKPDQPETIPGTDDTCLSSMGVYVFNAPPLNLYDTQWPIRTFAVQAPPAKFVFDSEDRCGAAVNSMICDGCIISGALIRNSVVCNNVVAHEQTDIDECVLLPDCVIGEQCRLKRVVIDRHCIVPAGMVIGYDRENDASRFHVSKDGIVLVTKQMIDALNTDTDNAAA